MKNKINKRGKRKSSQNENKFVRLMGVNANGILSKWTSFQKVLAELNPSVFFMEETKCRQSGRFKKLKNYITFELLRKDKGGGGLAIGCIKNFKPVCVQEGENDIESLSVNIHIKDMKIRCVVVYGPKKKR